jgi:hypothetical protein
VVLVLLAAYVGNGVWLSCVGVRHVCVSFVHAFLHVKVLLHFVTGICHYTWHVRRYSVHSKVHPWLRYVP